MKFILVILTIIVFETSLLAIEGEKKYTKVITNIEKYYYQPITTAQIINRGIHKFVDTTNLLTNEEKKKIDTKFRYYDDKYLKNSIKSANKKVHSIKSFLSKQMFSEEEIYDLLIHKCLESLDPHSMYLDKKHMADLKIQTDGVFGGLGISVGIKDNKLTVISPLDGTPAFFAGIKAGDVILKIDDLSSENMSLDRAVSLMRGKVDTSITLTILRYNKIMPVTIIRSLISIKSVHTKKLPNNMLYLRISSFDKKVLKKITVFLKEKDSYKGGIILDLRNNPGGLLNQAIGVVDLFISRGNIITQKGRSSIGRKTYDASTNKTLTKAPLVVLINSGSASASEIVSGALQMHSRATLIGERSFGKGSVQAILPINNEEYMKITIAEYLLADGNSINRIGIKPDFEIEADVIEVDDKVLEAAKDYLLDKKLFESKVFAKAYRSQAQKNRYRNQNISNIESKQ